MAASTGASSAPTFIDSARASVFRKSVVGAIKAAFGIVKKVFRIKAEAAGLDRDFVEKAIASADPDPGALEEFCDSLDALLKKHNCEPKNSEEISFGLNTLRLAAPWALTFSMLNAEIQRKRAAEITAAKGVK